MIAREATPGAVVDCSEPVSDSALNELATMGVTTIVRTLALPGNRTELTEDEAKRVLAHPHGFALSAYQRVRAAPAGMTGWDPRAHSGAADATYALAQLSWAPRGWHIWSDWEDVLIGAPETGCVTFLDDVSSTIVAGGFPAGMYVGFQQPLSSETLFRFRYFDRYASDIGDRKVAVRGTCWLQTHFDRVNGGMKLDVGVLRADSLGGLPMVLAA